MNLSKHRSTRFVMAKDRLRAVRTPLLESDRQISSEYTIPLFEVVKKKNRIKDTIPVHIRKGSTIIDFYWHLVLKNHLIEPHKHLCLHELETLVFQVHSSSPRVFDQRFLPVVLLR